MIFDTQTEKAWFEVASYQQNNALKMYEAIKKQLPKQSTKQDEQVAPIVNIDTSNSINYFV